MVFKGFNQKWMFKNVLSGPATKLTKTKLIEVDTPSFKSFLKRAGSFAGGLGCGMCIMYACTLL